MRKWCRTCPYRRWTEDLCEKEISLEEAFTRLQETIENLEKDDITLEQSFQEYQKGMLLVKKCNEIIDKVEKKVLVLNEDGGTDEF